MKNSRYLFFLCSFAAALLVFTQCTPPEVLAADRLWNPTPVFEDTFSGNEVSMTDWGKAWSVTSLSLSNERMITEKGYSYIKRPSMDNYAVEFDLTKLDQTQQDSYLRLQFRTPEKLGHDDYLYMIMFRPGGIHYYDPQSAAGGKLSDLGTNVGDSPLYVRVEAADGWVTVYAKTSPDGVYEKQGVSLYADTLLNQATSMCFYDYNVKTSIDNVRLYEELPVWKVTYDYGANGGPASADTFVMAPGNEAVDLSLTIERENGWTLIGWNTAGNAHEGMEPFVPTEEVYLYAIYEKSITVTFQGYNGLEIVQHPPVSRPIYNHENTQIPTPNPTPWPGWAFGGWSLAAGQGVSVNIYSPVTTDADRTLYGVYKRTVTLTYDANEGIDPPPSWSGTQYAHSANILNPTKPSVTLAGAGAMSREGYVFDGWKDADTDISYAAGDTFDLAGNTTMKAVWKPQTYTVTYDYGANGGPASADAVVPIDHDTPVDLSPTIASENGWTLIGWNTAQNAHEGMAPFLAEDEVYLYAIYEKSITVTFQDYNGLEIVQHPPVSRSIYNHESTQIPTPNPTPWPGWAFGGWSLAAGQGVSVNIYSPVTTDADRTLYGVYKRTVTLTYDANEGIDPPPSWSGTQYAHSANILNPTKPSVTLAGAGAMSREGYVFDGWKDADTDISYAAGDTFALAGNTTMKAVWKPQTYTVTYDYGANGGPASADAVVPIDHDAPVDLSPTIERENGWTLIGWNTARNAHEGMEPFPAAGDVYLYAVYEKTVTATFIDYDGTRQVIRPSEPQMIYNRDTARIPIPTLCLYPGWEAQGWVTQSDASSGGFNPRQIPFLSIPDDQIFYGLYERQVTLTFEADGGLPEPESVPCSQVTNSADVTKTWGGQIFQLPSVGKSDADFLGWALNSISGALYQPGWALVDLQGAPGAVMYALWQGNGNEDGSGEDTFKPRVGVYYYPGWHEGAAPQDWGESAGQGSWYRVKEYAPERKPLKGWYDDTDVTVVNQQLEEMYENGIDFIAWDWGYKNGRPSPGQIPGEEGAIDAYLASEAKSKMPYALTWDPSTTWPWKEPPGASGSIDPADLATRPIQSLEEWDALFCHIVDYHMQRPEYLTVDVDGVSMPVFFIINSQFFVYVVDYIAIKEGIPDDGHSREEFRRTILERARDIARSRELEGIFFVGQADNQPHWYEAVPKNYGFDAISAYNYKTYTSQIWNGNEWEYKQSPKSTSYSGPGGLTEIYSKQWNTILSNLPTKVNNDGSESLIPYFLPITAGWDATPWLDRYRNDPHNNSFPTSADEFRAHLQEARDLLVANPEKTWGICLIYAWNEFGEGGYIEPSKKYEDSLLKQVKEVFGN